MQNRPSYIFPFLLLITAISFTRIPKSFCQRPPATGFPPRSPPPVVGGPPPAPPMTGNPPRPPPPVVGGPPPAPPMTGNPPRSPPPVVGPPPAPPMTRNPPRPPPPAVGPPPAPPRTRNPPRPPPPVFGPPRTPSSPVFGPPRARPPPTVIGPPPPPPTVFGQPTAPPKLQPPPVNITVVGQGASGKGKGAAKRWIIGLGAGFAALMITGVMIYYLGERYSWWKAIIIKWKADDVNNQLVEEFMRNYGSIAPKLYTFTEIKKMTGSFSDKLGRGGFGCVYRGKLPDGRAVAVKVLNNDKGNGEDFINEVAAISRTSHINVVALLGFSYNSKKRALIYEFMPNGSLDKFISKDGLEWKLFYEIALGIACGLDYLHRGCSTRIVHLDIKPQNILLDANFCPKISDFGLAGLCKNRQSILSTMGARGTIGYIAPEVFCRNFGGISHKSDVYSYGMMILEMVGLRSRLETDDSQQESTDNYFPNWIYEHLELGKMLPLEGITSEEENETVMKMIFVGLWCIQTNPWDRPSISKVVEMLEGSLHSLQMPPKPFLGSPQAMNSDQRSWTTSSVS